MPIHNDKGFAQYLPGCISNIAIDGFDGIGNITYAVSLYLPIDTLLFFLYFCIFVSY